MSRRSGLLAGVLVGLLAAAGLGGCALWGGGAREIAIHPELERTRDLIELAAKGPTISSQFKGELDRARTPLDHALMIWNAEQGDVDEDDDEGRDIRHLNYLARQRTAIVVMKARGLNAQRELAERQSAGGSLLARADEPQARRPVVAGEAALPALLRELRPRQETRGLVLTLDEHRFGEGQRLVNSDPLLDTLLQYLVANPTKVVACEGYADAAEQVAGGQKASQDRARAVQAALLERGLELSRVTAVGYGHARPDGAGAEGPRRVEIVISDTVPMEFSDDKP